MAARHEKRGKKEIYDIPGRVGICPRVAGQSPAYEKVEPRISEALPFFA